MRPLHTHLLALLTLTVVPGLKTIAKAQTLSGLPSCARPALTAAFQAAGCKATDRTCLCSNPSLFAGLYSAIENACHPAEQAAVIAFGETFCGIQSTMTGMPMLTTSAVLPHGTSTSTSASYHKTMTYSTTATASSTSAISTGGAAETGSSAAALALAVGGMGWLFAEF